MTLVASSRPPAHHRKRYAGHHRQTKNYLRHYRPYLPMLLVVALGLFINGAWSRQGVLGASSDFSASVLLNDTNAQRAKAGEPSLALDRRLSAAAQAKAEDMARSDYWAHNSPSGKTPWTFITGSGYRYQRAGENLAYGFAGAADSVAGWMNSPEHRSNILDTDYKDVGFGVASSPDFVGQGPETIVVAEYAQPAPAGASGGTSDSTSGGAVGLPDGTGPAGVRAVDLESRPVSRIQLLTGGQPSWSLLAVVGITAFAGALFVLRHGYKVHRWATAGERFITSHPYYDLAIVIVITAGVLLTRVGGIVR